MQTSVRRERRSSLSSSANPSFLFFICSFRRASFVRTTATRDVRPRVDPHLTPRACRSTPARARFVSVFVTTPLLFAMPLLFFLLALNLGSSFFETLPPSHGTASAGRTFFAFSSIFHFDFCQLFSSFFLLFDNAFWLFPLCLFRELVEVINVSSLIVRDNFPQTCFTQVFGILQQLCSALRFSIINDLLFQNDWGCQKNIRMVAMSSHAISNSHVNQTA